MYLDKKQRRRKCVLSSDAKKEHSFWIKKYTKEQLFIIMEKYLKIIEDK